MKPEIDGSLSSMQRTSSAICPRTFTISFVINWVRTVTVCFLTITELSFNLQKKNKGLSKALISYVLQAIFHYYFYLPYRWDVQGSTVLGKRQVKSPKPNTKLALTYSSFDLSIMVT